VTLLVSVRAIALVTVLLGAGSARRARMALKM
jgi:hypothetical protein